ncbi:MAG: deaminase [Burkholderiales bacterium]
MNRSAGPRRRRLVAWIAFAPAASRALASPVAPPVPPPTGPAAFAARAMALRDEAVRRGDQPYGAVVVMGDRIVGEGVSAVIARGDTDAHAERLAIADARRRLGTADLDGARIYGSSPACAACRAAARDARIARLYHGAAATDDGPPS